VMETFSKTSEYIFSLKSVKQFPELYNETVRWMEQL
jgi:hypothetical protein